MPAPKITPEIEKIIRDLYTNSKLGAPAISDILLEDYDIVLHRSPIGKYIKKSIASGDLKKVATIEKASTLSQRGVNYGKAPNNYRKILKIDDNSRLRYPGRYPEDANFKVQTREGGETIMRYFKTEAEAQQAIDDTTIKLKGPKPGRATTSKKRLDNEKLGAIGASKKDNRIFNEFKGGIKKLNLYFKNDPELINNSPFGRNIKKMLAFRLDKDTPGVYSKLQSDNYYSTKAKQGQLFDLFDINPVAGKKRGRKSAINYNLSPNTFNRAFVGSQLTNFFKKGVNEDTAASLDKLFKEYNIRVDLPNVGKIGVGGGDVAFDSKTGSFPRAIETLNRLGAPDEAKDFFRSIAALQPGSKSFKVICTNLKASGGTIDSCLDIVAKDPEAAAIKFKNLDVQSGPLVKVKNAANTFLDVAKKDYGVMSKLGKTGKLGAIAGAGVLGAAAVGRVKEFMSDDPSTYLSSEEQQKNMLIDMAMEPVNERPEILDAQLPVMGAALAAGTIPGARDTYLDARTGRGPKGPAGSTLPANIVNKPVGKFRAALGINKGVLGKGLAALGTPAGLLATEPFYLGEQIAAGDSAGEIATNPMNYLGAAFTGPLTEMATKNVTPKIASIMRLGISPALLKTVSRRFGMPGLALSLGISGYEMFDDYRNNKGMFRKSSVGGINFD